MLPLPTTLILPNPSATTGEIPESGVTESIPIAPPVNPIVREPAPGVITTPGPAVMLAATGGRPVDPITTWPSVRAEDHPKAAAVPVP